MQRSKISARNDNPIVELLENNQRWAAQMFSADPNFFSRLEHQQKPRFLWFGCSDSRVPANQITGLPPGQVFVHRNIANQVLQTDLNALTVLQYAVDVLEIDQIIICGHYGCSGIYAALTDVRFGLVDLWLSHIREVRRVHREELDAIANESERSNRLAEWNVIHQALHVAQTTTVESAWKRKRKVAVHAWVYSLANGLIRDLGVKLESHQNAVRLGKQLRTIPLR
jgi:carbonic anhydrase